MGDDRVFFQNFGAQAVDELVDGVVGDAGAVFDVGVDDFTDLVFGN